MLLVLYKQNIVKKNPVLLVWDQWSFSQLCTHFPALTEMQQEITLLLDIFQHCHAPSSLSNLFNIEPDIFFFQ